MRLSRRGLTREGHLSQDCFDAIGPIEAGHDGVASWL
jgi:hypothetical protein